MICACEERWDEVGGVWGGEIFVNFLKLVLLHIKNSESVKVPELLENK